MTIRTFGRARARGALPAAVLLATPLLVGLAGCGIEPPSLLSTAEAAGVEEPADPVRALLSLPTPDSSAVDAGIEALKAAYAATSPAAARAALDVAVRRLPLLADWLPLFEAELAARAGLPTETLAALDRIPAGSGLMERWGGTTLLQALEKAPALSPLDLAPRIESMADLHPEPSASAGVLARLATRMDGVAPERARALRIRAMERASGSPGALSAARGLLRAGVEGQSRTVITAMATELERHGRWADAVPLRRSLLEEGGAPQELAALRLALARAHARAGDGPAALRLLEGGSDAPEVSAIRVRALMAAGRERDADAEVLRAARLWPTHEATAQALLFRARALEGASPDRLVPLLTLLNATGRRAVSLDALMHETALRLYEGRRHAEAARLLEDFAQGHPRVAARQRALFWAGLSRARLGETEAATALLQEARSVDPLSWYGVRAAQWSGLPWLPNELAHGPDANPAQVGRLLANAVVRLRVHLAVPTSGSFAVELDRLSTEFDRIEGGRHALAEAMLEGGLTLQGIRYARSLSGGSWDGWDRRLLRTAYPFPYQSEIRAMAEREGVDPFFVAGLIRQESLFTPAIRSGAGAVGLMQVMPATGQAVARQLGMRGFTTAQLAHPETNLALGTRYLADQLRRFGGREMDALAAYNAGPTRMSRWRSMPEYDDPDLWVERIPFAETRGYVRAVTLNWSVYTALYGCGGAGSVTACPRAATALTSSPGPSDAPPTARGRQ